MSSFQAIKNLYQLLIVFILLLIGCAPPINNLSKPHVSLYTQDYASSESISETILLIADNQITEERNRPILENSSAIARETLVGRSVYRNGVATGLSPTILQYILSKNKDKLVIHVGDALNNSCVSEYELFEKVMGKSTWFITPGNHDGYYMGLTTPLRKTSIQPGGILNDPKGWCQICRPYFHFRQPNCKTCKKLVEDYEEGKYSLNKRQFIKRYLKSLGLDSYENKLSYNKIQDNIWGRRNKYLSKAEWTICNEEQPWKNFIVQQLYAYSSSNNKVFAVIIIDTACYGAKPNLASYNGAADTGEIIKKQQIIVEKWLKNIKEESLPVVLIGHHTLDDLTQNSMEAIRDWYEDGLFEIYISGDVHDGYDVIHQRIKNENNGFLKEFNLGSTIDAPIEYATLSLKQDHGFETKRYFMTPFEGKRHTKYKYPKSGMIDDIWNECETKCGKYNGNNREKYMAHQANEIDDILNNCRFCFPSTRFTLTKLRRYSEMFHVYKKIFQLSDHPKKQAALEIIDEAIQLIDIQVARGNIEGSKTLLIRLSCYLDGKKCDVTYNTKGKEKWHFKNTGLKSLQEMILEIEDTPEKRDLKKKIVCFALFSIEDDYPKETLGSHLNY